MSVCVTVRAGELAVAPTSSGRGQAHLTHCRHLSKRELTADPGSSVDRWRPTRAVGHTLSTANQVEQPLVHHEVADVADRARLRTEPGDDVAIEDATYLLRTIRARSAEVVVGSVHPHSTDRSHVGPELSLRSRWTTRIRIDYPGPRVSVDHTTRLTKDLVACTSTPDRRVRGRSELLELPRSHRRHVRNGATEGSHSGGGTIIERLSVTDPTKPLVTASALWSRLGACPTQLASRPTVSRETGASERHPFPCSSACLSDP